MKKYYHYPLFRSRFLRLVMFLSATGLLFGLAPEGSCQEFKKWDDFSKKKEETTPAEPAKQETAVQPPDTGTASQATPDVSSDKKDEAAGSAGQEGGEGAVSEDESKKSPKEASELEAIKKEITEELPLMEIKRLESDRPLYSIELRAVELTDLFRVLAHDYDLNILVDRNVSGRVSASFTGIALDEALAHIADMQGLVIEKKGNAMLIKLNLLTKVFSLSYVEAKPFLTSGTPQATALAGLLSKEGKSFLGNQPNSIMVIDYPDNLERIENYLTMADKSIEAKVFKLKFLNARDVVGTAQQQ